MKKVLIGGLVLSGFLFGECTQSEINRAEKIFNKSLSEHNFNKKLAFIKEAQQVCGIKQIDVALNYLAIKNDLQMDKILDMEMRLQNLSSSNDALDSRHYQYKEQMGKDIEILFAQYYQKVGKVIVSEPTENDVYKNLKDINGLYKSYLTFYYNSSRIKDKREAKKIKRAIGYILKKNPNARFSITGHSSSGGSYGYNKRLSGQRARSLGNFIGKVNHLRFFSKGEIDLACHQGLAYRDKHGEYHCRGKENKARSRRVEIRRTR